MRLPGVRPECPRGASSDGQAEVRSVQAPCQRRHHRPRRPRQDDPDRGHHQGPRREGRGHRGALVRLDRQGPGGARARHHHRHRPRRVLDREAPLRPRRLSGPRRLHQEHDHRRRADGRRDPRGLGRRRPDAPDARAHPARPPGGRALHRGLPQQGRHGGRPRAARAGRARGTRAAERVRVPRGRHPGHRRLGAQRPERRPRGGRGHPQADGRGRRVRRRSPSATSTSRS